MNILKLGRAVLPLTLCSVGLVGYVSAAQVKKAEVLFVGANHEYKGMDNQSLQPYTHGSAESTVQYLKSLGFHLEVRQNRTLAFPEDVWQGEKMKRILALFSQLKSSIQSNWTLDFRSDPELTAFVEDLLAMSGAEAGDGTQISVQPWYTYTLTAGDRSVAVRVPTLPSIAGFGDMASHRAELKPDADKKMYDGGHPFSATPVSTYHYLTLTGTHGAADNGLAAFSYATELLSQHFEEFQREHDQAYQGLVEALTKKPLSKLLGLGFGDLPADVQSKIKGELQSRYKDLGFSSASEAEQFVGGAVTSGCSASLYFSYGLPGNGAASINLK